MMRFCGTPRSTPWIHAEFRSCNFDISHIPRDGNESGRCLEVAVKLKERCNEVRREDGEGALSVPVPYVEERP